MHPFPKLHSEQQQSPLEALPYNDSAPFPEFLSVHLLELNIYQKFYDIYLRHSQQHLLSP